MTIDDFRRIALSLEGAEESSHMGQPDFRVGGRIFATLAAAAQGYGNLMLTPEQQATFVEELPEVFIPIPGRWGEKRGRAHSIGGCEQGCTGRRVAYRVEVEAREESQITQEKKLVSGCLKDND